MKLNQLLAVAFVAVLATACCNTETKEEAVTPAAVDATEMSKESPAVTEAVSTGEVVPAAVATELPAVEEKAAK